MPTKKEQQQVKDLGSSHSTATEYAAVANMLVYGGDCKLLNLLDPEDFFDPPIREVWEAMQELKEEDREIDFVSVCEKIDKSTTINPGILASVVSQSTNTGSDDNIYKILRKHRATRESVGVYREALERPIEDIPGLMSDQSKRIADFLPKPTEANFDELIQELSGTDDRIPTYIPFADEFYGGGLAKEALHIFAGRPGTGKSSMMTTFCAEWIRHNIPFCFISLEMSKKEVLTRILCAYHNVTAEEVRENAAELSEVFREADFNIIVGTGSLQAVQAALLTAEEHILIVDHLGLIRDQEASNKVQEVSNVTRMLKTSAMEIQKPVLACCQMSRSIEQGPSNREPRLSDLRDSGSIEQDADNVTFLWNPHAKDDVVQKVKDDLEGNTTREIRFIVRKQRNGPADLYQKLAFAMPKYSFRESEMVEIPKVEQKPTELPF